MIERKDFAFFVEINYKNSLDLCLDLCNNYKIVGRRIENCKRISQDKKRNVEPSGTKKLERDLI